MKFVTAAAVAAAVAVCVPAMAQAQDKGPTGAYVNLGYAFASQDGIHLGAIQGKLGYRFHPYFGIEGEGAFGIDGDKVTTSVGTAKVKLSHEFAAYGVGFLPVNPNADLLARVGYGTTKIHASSSGFGASGSDESWNFGVGGQYHFDGVNGIRVEYTRSEYNDGGHANLWGVAYSRRF